jgi:Arginase family
MALREADIVGRLSRSGVAVIDHGDSAVRRWRPDKENRRAQNLAAVAEVAHETSGRVREAREAGHLPLVLGGDCTIELGTVAGFLGPGGSDEERVGLIYFDVHPDLNVPSSVGEGALDWMGVAHMLGVEGAAEPLSRFGPRFPLLSDEDLYLFSYGPEQATEHERSVIERRGLKGPPQAYPHNKRSRTSQPGDKAQDEGGEDLPQPRGVPTIGYGAGNRAIGGMADRQTLPGYARARRAAPPRRAEKQRRWRSWSGRGGIGLGGNYRNHGT